ncbi:MAG: hypothetical protein ACLP1E_15215 [Acidimicrobiales bacterium]
MPRQPKHTSTYEALDLDIRALARAKNLREGTVMFATTWTHGLSESGVGITVVGGEYALVSYSERGEAITEHIGIEWTSCNYGGVRPWWSCPQCERRCAIVYAVGVRPFACRLCANVTYETAQADAFTRAICKTNKRRARLGWEWGKPFPPKPKGMHRRTWMRLVAECSDAVWLEKAVFDAWAERVEREIEHLGEGAAVVVESSRVEH